MEAGQSAQPLVMEELKAEQGPAPTLPQQMVEWIAGDQVEKPVTAILKDARFLVDGATLELGLLVQQAVVEEPRQGEEPAQTPLPKMGALDARGQIVKVKLVTQEAVMGTAEVTDAGEETLELLYILGTH